MKTLVPIQFFFIIITSSVFCQPFMYISKPYEESAYDILEYKDCYIISYVEITSDSHLSHLIKIGKDGTIIADTVIGSDLTPYRMLKVQDNIAVFSREFNDSLDRGYFAFTLVDSNLNQTNRKSLFVSKTVYKPGLFDVILTSDSMFLLVGDTYDTGYQYPLSNRSLIFYLISLEGDSIKSTSYTGEYNYFRECNDIIERDTDYIAFANNVVQYEAGNILTLSKDLVIQDTFSIPNELKDGYSPLRLNDSSYIICTRSLISSYTMYVSKLSKNLQLIKSKPVGKANSFNMPAWLKSLDIVRDKIYLLGGEDLALPNIYYGIGRPSQLIVKRLDYNLNTIWTRELGKDYYYFPNTIKATSDGGCILIGTINDTLNYMNTTTDIFVFKLDSNGQITYTTNISPLEPYIELYPNPASQELHIQKSNDSDVISNIDICSITGNMLRSIKSNSNSLSLDISDLAIGTYLIKGSTRYGKQFQKKFIKNR